MKYLATAIASLFISTGAAAAGQFGSSPSPSLMVGSYGSGLGGKFSYTAPLNIDGLARSGMGVVVKGDLGGGIANDDVVMSSMLGANLVFVVNNDFDVYGGLGVGSRLLPDSYIGAGGKIGINFRVDNTRLFIEGGSHPGSVSFLGVGMRL